MNEELDNLQEALDHSPIIAPNAEQMMKSVIPVSDVMKSREANPSYDRVNSPAILEDWNKFKTANKHQVNLLVKEFERRKAAFQYSRAQRSATGSIDTNKLHSYKFEDQIFKSITKLADAKSHGMMFFIDYSGSMHNDIGNVIDHTLNLVFFCKAVGIPFEVYGFTSPSPDIEQVQARTVQQNTVNDRQISMHDCITFELVNSSMKKNDYDLACRQLRAQSFLLSSINEHRCGRGLPLGSVYEVLNSTPLSETIMIAHELVKRFKQKHAIQKMNVIFLTDGGGSGLAFGRNTSTAKYAKSAREFKGSYRVRIAGRQIDLLYGQPSQHYAALIENLRITCDVTAIGFFISSFRSQLKTSAINAIRYSGAKKPSAWSEASEKVNGSLLSDLRKNKCMFIKNGFAFDEYFIVSGGKDLSINDSTTTNADGFTNDANTDTTTARGQNTLAKAFTKYNSDKRSSRLILNKFATLVA